MGRRGFVLFASMSVLWGIPYFLIKVAVESLSPVTLVFARTAMAAALLGPIALVRGELAPVLTRWRPLVVYAVAELGVPWVLLSSAERRLPSSLSGLLVAGVPLVGAALAWAGGDGDHLGVRGVTGLVVGLGGVALLAGVDVSGSDVGSVAMVAVVVVGYAIGPRILARELADLPALGVVTASLALCAVAYAPFALVNLPAAFPPGRVVAAVMVLGVPCTALAFVLFFALVGQVGAVRGRS